MSYSCQGCGEKLGWDVSWDDAPVGEEIFIHERGTKPWETRRSIYCSLECLVDEVGEC